MPLPRVPSLEIIAERLPLIFPDGMEHRNYAVREIAAKTIYVMFYAGAIEGADSWIRPSQVTDMTDIQASALTEEARHTWIRTSLSAKKQRPSNTWYAVNSREPIRDETIRTAFVPCRAVLERPGLPPTSSRPKYALNANFAELFNPALVGEALGEAILKWQGAHLNKNALARVQLLKMGAAAVSEAVSVHFPDGAVRQLSPGASSIISKALIEIFAPQFLQRPAVLWLSESGNKVVARDDVLAKRLGLNIDPAKALPDVILVDIGEDVAGTDMLVVFAEVVATDGPINRERKIVLTALARDAGFDPKHIAFLTAYMDRGKSAFKKSVSDLAWGSYAWFLSEPGHIMAFTDDSPGKLSGLLQKLD